MSNFLGIQLALDSHLDSAPLDIAIAWDNIDHSPTEGIPYIMPFLVPSPSSSLTMKDDQVNNGLYQINVFYPVSTGPRDILNKMDEIYTHFKSVNSVTHGSTEVLIRQVSRSTATNNEIWYTANLIVNFTNYSSQ